MKTNFKQDILDELSERIMKCKSAINKGLTEDLAFLEAKENFIEVTNTVEKIYVLLKDIKCETTFILLAQTIAVLLDGTQTTSIISETINEYFKFKTRCLIEVEEKIFKNISIVQ